jgi:glycerol-3-phosphate acyltransferase PlsY
MCSGSAQSARELRREKPMTHFGARLMALTAILGTAISVYNYFAPMSGIDHTPGALLVIVSTLILFALAMLMAAPFSSAALRVFLASALLLGILGTAFAAYLLNSNALLALMCACLVGWLMQVAAPRRALA